MGYTEDMEKLGFKKGTISECIVTTYNDDKSPNAAPIGVRTENGLVVMKIHTFTDTYRNIVERKCCVLNIVYDPYLFLKTAITGQGKGEDEPEIDSKLVTDAKHVESPYISDANTYIELKLQSREEKMMHDRHGEGRVSIIKCEVESVNILKEYPPAVNRGIFAAIEVAIPLSRGKKKDVTSCLKIMKKTLTNEEYEKIEKLLEGRL